MLFSSVCGSGTLGALCITAVFTAFKSCTILHFVDGAAFFTGKIGVLHGDSGQGIKTPAFKYSLITGRIPSIASCFRAYCFMRGRYSPFGLI